MTLQEIKEYYGKRCKPFPILSTVSNKLSPTTKDILYNIGLPDHRSYGGDYFILPELTLADGKYLHFASRIHDQEFFKLSIDTDTQAIVFNYSYDEDNSYYFKNSDLESYLKHIYTHERFLEEVSKPEIFGDYFENSEIYAKELEKRFKMINKDIVKGSWATLIEEMEDGLI